MYYELLIIVDKTISTISLKGYDDDVKTWACTRPYTLDNTISPLPLLVHLIGLCFKLVDGTLCTPITNLSVVLFGFHSKLWNSGQSLLVGISRSVVTYVNGV